MIREDIKMTIRYIEVIMYTMYTFHVAGRRLEMIREDIKISIRYIKMYTVYCTVSMYLLERAR
jgi:hypothetical protein